MDITAETLQNVKQISYNFSALYKAKGGDKINVENASKNLVDTINLCLSPEIRLDCWIMYGTLLGIYRDGELISYDRDVDLGVFYSDIDKITKLVEEMKKIGFEIIRVSKHLFTMLRSLEYVDFSVFYPIDDNTYMTRDVYDHVPIHYIKKEHLETLRSLIYRDEHVIPMPFAPDLLLAEWYGQDWRTPTVGKYAYM